MSDAGIDEWEELDRRAEPGNELIDFLRPLGPNLRRPGGVTAREMAGVWGISQRQAGKKLGDLVQQGVLTCEDALVDAHVTKVYYKK